MILFRIFYRFLIPNYTRVSMNLRCILLLYGIFMLCPCISGHFKDLKREPSFMSVSRMLKMMETEKMIVREFKYMIDKYRYTDPDIVSLIESYTDRYDEMISSGKTFKEIASHPIDAYYLMKNVTLGWNKIMDANDEESDVISGILEQLSIIRKNAKYPELFDINTIASSLGRLQDVYQLEIEDMIRGIIIDPKSKTVFRGISSLNAWDCIVIGREAVILGLFDKAVDWMMTAKRLEMEGDRSITLETIEEKLETTILRHDYLLIQQGRRGPGWKTHRFPINTNLTKDFRDRLEFGNSEFRPQLYYRSTFTDLREQLKCLCRGEKLRPRELDNSLYSHYVHNNNPYLMMGPFKVEHLSEDFPMMMMHDFISDSEVERLKSLSSPHLNDSEYAIPNNDGTYSKYTGKDRISQQYFIPLENDSKFLSRLLSRCERAFQIKFMHISDRPIRVINYGLGGHYVLHRDYGQTEDGTDENNRILTNNGDFFATIIFHLSDVEAGGATGFPVAGASVLPEKRAATIWYNTNRAGKADFSTHHGGCPVLYGSKWIVTISPFLYDQMFTPSNCGTHVLEKYPLL